MRPSLVSITVKVWRWYVDCPVLCQRCIVGWFDPTLGQTTISTAALTTLGRRHPLNPGQAIKMKNTDSTTVSSYNPSLMLDTVLEKMNLKSDAALCRALNVSPSTISRIRRQKTAVGSVVLLRINEATGINTRELRTLMGDRRRVYRVNPCEK